ncbi:MAG: N-6 DNA methylase [Acidobacteria bacterium]|nr:N-6 DNA methylase [Acidobacteriota bacterium]
MTITEFIAKWRRVDLKERSASQQHFLDLCALVGQAPPAEADPTGEEFCFEKGASKAGGGEGWADVWKRGCFAWEYKGRLANLTAAYQQLLQYKDALDNPPLLVVSDMDRLVIRTNFTNTPARRVEFGLDDLVDERNFATLKAVFFEPDKLKPEKTTQRITEDAAERVTQIAALLRERGEDPQRVARFLDRIVFCLFAEDVGLLPDQLFTRLVAKAHGDPVIFSRLLAGLFEAMAHGGEFGVETVHHFNGQLFADAGVLTLTPEELDRIHLVTGLDWSAIDPSIFGTLFERALDPAKRSQFGAHYTSRDDIETIVDPVVMAPLRREWDGVRAEVDALVVPDHKKGDRTKADAKIQAFLHRLQHVTVLDPACGSGNFLYVVLQKLKNLEKQVILYAMDRGFSGSLPQVGPWQLHGIEINPYAYELAQMTVWIGWLQWIQTNGFGEPQEPILQVLDTFTCGDAILTQHADGTVTEPEWPKVDFIVSNPPFLGGKKLRTELGNRYVEAMFALWKGRVPAEADLCCYWFEKARRQIETGACQRAGLLATQGIRGGANRRVVDHIKAAGDIFFAHSDREWILDGAAVHVSMLGFDDGADGERLLDGKPTVAINADLTYGADLTAARRLARNAGLSFMADTKGGAFDVSNDKAEGWLRLPSPNGRPNSDVLRPWANGLDVVRRPRGMWIIDFPPGTAELLAAQYEAVFEHIREHVLPIRRANKRVAYAARWWMHVEPRPEMRRAIAGSSHFLSTITVSKYRLFAKLPSPTLPDHQLIVFARDDDYFFGVLHARLHELWARSTGTQLREAESGFRYTPTSCFETFPFPSPTDVQRDAIGAAANELDTLRSRWLNPPEWVKDDVLEFPASVDGPWARMVTNPNADGIGTARYVRLLPIDDKAAAALKKRTLTNLYNERPAWLANAHRALDEAVFAAYGWAPSLTDDELLAKLLELNLAASGTQDTK